MASMTDYMQKVLQESAEVVAEPEKSEEELSAAILESYLSMSAAFATIENAFECASICAFCESAEIDKPTEATVVVESFWDSVKNVFETIIDWFKSVISGFIGLFTSAKLQKLIAKLKTMDQKNGEFTHTVNNLNSTLEEISKASRSMKNLTDYLERHPEAIIQGKEK